MLELLIRRSAPSVGGSSWLAGMVTPSWKHCHHYLAYPQGADICWLVLGLDTAKHCLAMLCPYSPLPLVDLCAGDLNDRREKRCSELNESIR